MIGTEWKSVAQMNKFLIVDDLRQSRSLLARLVSTEFPDSEILQASDGEDALVYAHDDQPDLILLDAAMPGMSGFEVCRRIKSDPATSSILILMVSGVLTNTSDRISGLKSGADSYLCKPFENEELIAQIRALLRIHEYEKELREARRTAESAVRAKSRFLAQMSHEIRTPMNAVIGMTSLLANTTLSEQQAEYASTIRSSGESLLNIINDILDFSKIESGKLKLDIQDFELGKVVEEVLTLLSMSAYKKGLEVAYWIDTAVPRSVRGDPNRLRQILMNLVGNAIKFTDAGSIYVNVKRREPKAEDGSGPECIIEFKVQDTGIGIPKKDFDSLFDAFSQVDDSNTRKFMGTGLGLATQHLHSRFQLERFQPVSKSQIPPLPWMSGVCVFWLLTM